MNLRLHANATTTPKIRRYIQSSTTPVAQLARELNVSEDTIRRWRRRDNVVDGSHTPHRLQTTLAPAQEVVVVELRKSLLLSLDDLLTVTREFIHPKMSRSGLDRCLRRHGVSNLRALRKAQEKKEEGNKKPVARFKTYEPGYLHIDIKSLPQLPDEQHRRYLFVAIDRATRWVYIEIRAHKSAQDADAFLAAVHNHAPFKIKTILTDNDKAFTDRFSRPKSNTPTGAHRFDRRCAERGIEHRLITPYRPQTNGMVERFNGRIADVLRTHHFDSSASLHATLKRFVHLYNYHIPQKGLRHKTPFQALEHWYAQQPLLFNIKPANLPGPDT